MERIRSVLVRVQPSGKNFLLTLNFIDKRFDKKFRNFLLKNKTHQFYKGNYAHRLDHKNYSIGFEVNCPQQSIAQMLIDQLNQFSSECKIPFSVQKMEKINHHDSEEHLLVQKNSL